MSQLVGGFVAPVAPAVHIQRWWRMWRFRKWLSVRRSYRRWVRDNHLWETLDNYPFHKDPLLAYGE